MIYTDIFKDKMDEAAAQAACVNETVMTFARILDKCATFAQNELGARVTPYPEPSDANDTDYIGISINLGSAADIEKGLDDTYIKNEPWVNITIRRYGDIDNLDSVIEFEHPADQRDCEKYDIAFKIEAWVTKINKDATDPMDILVGASCASSRVVFIKKYPDEILDRKENRDKFGDRKYRNDYERYEVIRTDENNLVLKFISDLWNGGCDEFIPEKFQEAYDDISFVIDEELKKLD